MMHTHKQTHIQGHTHTHTQTQTHTHTHSTRTDRLKVKTEGPKILSNDVFYFKTVIICGPIYPSVHSRIILCQIMLKILV